MTYIIYKYLLSVLLGSFLITAIFSEKRAGQIGVVGSGIALLLSIFLNRSYAELLEFSNALYNTNLISFVTLDVNLDGIAIIFIFLTNLLIFLTIIYILDNSNLKKNILLLQVLQILLVLAFSVENILGFYTVFEGIILPMFIAIGFGGSRARKVRALYLFIYFTFCSSILFLMAIFYVYYLTGSLSISEIQLYAFNPFEQKYLWLAFFFAFAAKIPMFPFHIWLPEAHVEASTIGSVILAGVLLKLGVYGFLRFNLTLLPEASLYYAPLVQVLSILGVIYASLSAIRQTDLKRVIAYSSVAHMNLVTLGIFSFNVLGVSGALAQSLSHGFVASGLFFLIGVIYERYHSRLLYYYSGLVQVMPLYTSFFLLFVMANIALPGTSSFVGEFLILIGVYKSSFFICFLGALGVILSGIYTLWAYNRIAFGNIKTEYLKFFYDLTLKEFFIMFILSIFVILMGVFPNYFLMLLEQDIYKICVHYM